MFSQIATLILKQPLSGFQFSPRYETKASELNHMQGFTIQVFRNLSQYPFNMAITKEKLRKKVLDTLVKVICPKEVCEPEYKQKPGMRGLNHPLHRRVLNAEEGV